MWDGMGWDGRVRVRDPNLKQLVVYTRAALYANASCVRHACWTQYRVCVCSSPSSLSALTVPRPGEGQHSVDADISRPSFGNFVWRWESDFRLGRRPRLPPQRWPDAFFLSHKRCFGSGLVCAVVVRASRQADGEVGRCLSALFWYLANYVFCA